MFKALKNFIVGEDLDQIKLLNTIAEKTDNAVIITDKHGLVLWVNQGFTQISGYTLEEVRGRKPGHILQGKDTDPQTVERIREHIKNQVPFRENILNYHKNGTAYWIQLNVTPVFSSEGKLENFIAFELDITEEKSREDELIGLLRELQNKNEELAQQEEEIRMVSDELSALNDDLTQKSLDLEKNLKELHDAQEQLRLLSLVAAYTDNAVIITSNKKEIEWVNPGFTRISGYTLEEVKGKSPGKILQGKDTDPETIQRIREKLGLKVSFQEEVLNYHKNGTPYWLNLSITPVLNSLGEVEKFIAIEMDITQKKATEKLIYTRKEELEASLNYAKRIQKALLPDESVLKNFTQNHFVYFQPKEEIGGDFYWFQQIDNRLVVAAADCTGHGVPGAMLSMYFQQFLNSAFHDFHTSNLADVAKLLHEALLKLQIEQNMKDSFEISIAVIDNEKVDIFTTDAQPVMIQKIEDSIEVVKSSNTIGSHVLKISELNSEVFEFQSYPKNQISRIYLMSDGIADQFGGPENKKFGITRLKSIFSANIGSSLKQIYKEVRFSIDTWKNLLEQTDDYILIGLEL